MAEQLHTCLVLGCGGIIPDGASLKPVEFRIYIPYVGDIKTSFLHFGGYYSKNYCEHVGYIGARHWTWWHGYVPFLISYLV